MIQKREKSIGEASASRSESTILNPRRDGGFSLLELLIVIAITVVLAIIATQAPDLGRSTRSRTLGGAVSRTIAEMGLARSRAITGEDERKWGVHFVNSTDDYYEIFSTPTTYADGGTAIHEVIYLPSGVEFSDPASGTLDIIFERISGTITSADSVTIASAGESTTISVNLSGLIE